MLGKLTAILFMLMAIGSAENVIVDNHSIEFNINDQYIIEPQESGIIIKTFNGSVTLVPKTGLLNGVDPTPIGLLSNGDKIGIIEDSFAYAVEGEDFTIISSFDLMDLMDFLKTLKVERIT